MLSAISERRSIRKYLDQEISSQDIKDIINSGSKAPSSKNRQPWKFIVAQGEAKQEMLHAFRAGIERETHGAALLPDSKRYLSGARHTIQIIDEAPTVIFVVNPLGENIFAELNPEERVYETCNIQSLSAAIQNMLLEATEKGIGSLWICDIFFAYDELTTWLNTDGELVAAVAFGYANENPSERRRKPLDDIVEWRA